MWNRVVGHNKKDKLFFKKKKHTIKKTNIRRMSQRWLQVERGMDKGKEMRRRIIIAKPT